MRKISFPHTTLILGIFSMLFKPLLAQHYMVKQRFQQTPTPMAPNYNNERAWAALPIIKDSSDAVPAKLQTPKPVGDADVFFIHPTTYTKKPKTEFLWSQDIADAALNSVVDESPIKYQASAFNATGSVYAPRYRQAHYAVFLTEHLSDKQQALDTAYADVKAAFLHYLLQWNQGKPFIIASHSQGTIHSARLIKEVILNTPLQEQLIAAYIPGMPVPKDSLPGLPVCVSDTATGCFVSWSTYRYDYIPPYYPLALERAICVNPITWDTTGNYIDKALHQGSVLTNFNRVMPQICDAQVKGGLLWVHRPQFPGSWLYRDPNYHIGDMNLFYIDVRNNACNRVNAYYTKKQRGKNQ